MDQAIRSTLLLVYTCILTNADIDEDQEESDQERHPPWHGPRLYEEAGPAGDHDQASGQVGPHEVRQEVSLQVQVEAIHRVDLVRPVRELYVAGYR